MAAHPPRRHAQSRRYDALFWIPWAAPLLTASGTTGGAETQIAMVARALAASGLDVAMAVIGDRSRLPREVDGVRVLALARPPGMRGLGGAAHDAGTLKALARVPAKVVVQRTPSRAVAVAAAVARARGMGLIYSSSSVRDFEPERIDRPYNAWLYQRGLRAADHIVAQTAEQAEMCRRRFGRDPVVIPSIAERAAPRSGAAEAFLWIGRLTEVKRLDVYLDLAAAVPEAAFRVIAVPHPDDRSAWGDRLERARAELPNLEVLEPRPRSELAPLVDRAVAVVSTSEYEGMPNVFLEGWARGVPALAFAHDPDGIVAEHGLGGFAGGSPERLAELGRAQWAARADSREVAERCIAYVRRHHDVEVACAAWRRLIVGEGA